MPDRYASLKQGLVGCWIPSISGSGLLLPDLSGRGNNGSLVGMDASDWVSASYGRALDFDGSNDYVDTVLDRHLSGSFSICCWVKLRSLGTTQPQAFVNSQVSSYSNYWFNFSTYQNALSFALFDGSNNPLTNTFAPQTNRWYFFCGVRDISKDTIADYVDGRFISSVTDTTTITPVYSSLTIGAQTTPANRYANAQIDDIRIYNRALTDSEIRLLSSEPGIGFKPAKKLSRFSQRFTYKPPKPRNYSVIRNRDPNYSTLRHGLVAAYCPSISGQGNVLPDLVGGNHGTLTNMTAEDWVASGDGRALDFDGSNDEVIANQSTPVVIAKSCSIAAWVNLPVVTGLTNRTIAMFGSNTTGFYSLQFSGSPGRFGFQGWDLTNNAEVTATAFSVVADQWIHVAGVASGGVYKIFINGKQENSQNDPHTVASQTAFRIGNGTGYSAFLSMKCDDVRLYNRGLTEPEIRLLASKRGIGLQPRNTHVTFADLGVQKTYSVVRVKETDYATLRQGLVGAWCPSLPNGGSGNTLPDVSGYGNHGTLTNMGPDDWVSSQYGRALDFDGVNDYVSVSSSKYLDSVSTFSISAWMKRNTAATVAVVQKAIGSGQRVTLSLFSDGNLYFVVANSVGVATYGSASYASTELTHVVGVFNGNLAGNSKAIVFINGSQIALSYTGTLPTTTADLSSVALEFGAERWANVYGSSKLDDIRIYNRALTESEIRLLASRPGIGLRQESHRNTFYQFPSGSRRKRILTGMP